MNLTDTAKSWAAPGSPYYADPDLVEAIVDGLQTLHDLQYNVDNLEFDNWYQFEIGGPRGIVEAVTLVGGILPDQLRADLRRGAEQLAHDGIWHLDARSCC